MPDEDSDDEENQMFEPEGDCVPGRKLVSNTEDTLPKTNLKGIFVLLNLLFSCLIYSV